MLVPREEVSVRPEREGLQISQVLVDAGETVTSGQVLARLVPPDAQPNSPQALPVQSPVGGIILKIDAIIGTTASARAAPLFQIVARGVFELLGGLPAKQLSKLWAGRPLSCGRPWPGRLPAKTNPAPQPPRPAILIVSRAWTSADSTNAEVTSALPIRMRVGVFILFHS